MKNSILIATIIAAACSGVAMAGDATQDQKTTQAPTIKATTMTDSEMDKVTAGSTPSPVGFGRFTAEQAGGNRGQSNPPFPLGLGRCTASGGGNCPIPSDIRLKRDIVQVSRLENGLGLYRYRYNWSDQVYVGVMAQEVALVRPDAVIRGADGYLRVDYSRLGLHLMTWDEWVASGGEKGLKHAKTAVQSSTQMSDAEMDKVTAGFTTVECDVAAALGGAGFCTALVTGHGNPVAAIPHLVTPTPSGVQPGAGQATATTVPK